MGTNVTMRLGSLFSGIGGLDRGLELAGMEVVWQVENDPSCARVLERHWPGVERHGDIGQVDPGRLRPVDVVCGGFPCQDLSVAGRRAGLDGGRSGLFHEFVRIADSQPAAWVLVENVPGLLSSQGGEDFGIVLRELTGFWPSVPDGGWRSAGCCAGPKRVVAWRVLDSQYFGVAQRRDRVFLVGGPRTCGVGPVEVLLEPEGVPRHPPARGAAGQVAPTIPASGAGTSRPGGPKSGSEDEFVVVNESPSLSRSPSASGTGTKNDDTHDTYVIQDVRGHTTDSAQNGPRWSQGNLSYTLGAVERHGVAYGINNQPIPDVVRRLTPRECERLQAFPDDWTAFDAAGKPIADSPRYRMLGNAVTVSVSEWIGKRLMAWFRAQDSPRP